MLRRLVRENIVIILNLDPGIDRVRVDPGQLDQVIVNLVMNSGDAMPKGGTIAVSTSNKVLTDAHTRVHPYVRPGRFVSLEVVDTGHGNGRGDGGAGVRAVLHDEADRQRHRAGAVDGVWDREAERRLCVGEQRARARNDRQHLPADSKRELAPSPLLRLSGLAQLTSTGRPPG